MRNRVDELKERIQKLNALKQLELSEKKPSQRYIEDLNTSIEGCERELGFLKAHPDGFMFVNGLTPEA